MSAQIFDLLGRQSKPKTEAPKGKFLVVEVVPVGLAKVKKAEDLKALMEGRVVARQFEIVDRQELAEETASLMADENPGKPYAVLEIVGFAFTVPR